MKISTGPSESTTEPMIAWDSQCLLLEAIHQPTKLQITIKIHTDERDEIVLYLDVRIKINLIRSHPFNVFFF